MSYEIECPVCDRKAQSTAKACPYCGADLTMASFDELEMVAQDIASGKVMETPALPSSAPKTAEMAPEPKAEMPKAAEPKPVKFEELRTEGKPAEEAERKEEEGKKGFGRLFGRKKK